MRGGCNFAQQLIQIEYRAEFLRQMRKRLQRTVLPVHAPVETRIVDGYGHPGRDQLEQRAILFAIRIEPRGLQIDDAYQLAAREHGHRELRLYSVERYQITRVVTDIAR